MEFIVYKGQKFIVEWYYDKNSKSNALEFFDSLTVDEQEDFLVLVKIMADRGKIFNKEKFRNEGDKIFAFKPKPNRFLCFFTVGKKIIVTNGFQKKQDKLPANEKERAKSFRTDYLERTKKRGYYEKSDNFRKSNTKSEEKKEF
ncbi:type II toxin-antitoxin system RelE/ParE family toxin [Leptospira alexanderi]|uniref:Gp49-like PF05973 family protein n=1 Tax=Leptospira alexanderi serovar Manhao 3 str. L 60 TaxID=1049759 RepID=V6I258_9LEPT|nr:type II toxin-antitoxin system RelE/ParE family toxin [Leptospira alexanderi]EQA64295.1 Gp49-like PF05973 family protein [Leptospira alexanderi serovar Manhao 3 str. L 60]